MVGEHIDISGLHLGNMSYYSCQKEGGVGSAHIRGLIKRGLRGNNNIVIWAGYFLISS